MAKHARIVSPLPYPSALYIAGAKSGKQKPAIKRKNARAASAAIALASVVRSVTRRWKLTRRSVDGERVKNVCHDALEDEDSPTADEGDADVRRNPVHIGARRPACDEQPDG